LRRRPDELPRGRRVKDSTKPPTTGTRGDDRRLICPSDGVHAAPPPRAARDDPRVADGTCEAPDH